MPDDGQPVAGGGGGDLDHSALVLALEKLANHQLIVYITFPSEDINVGRLTGVEFAISAALHLHLVDEVGFNCLSVGEGVRLPVQEVLWLVAFFMSQVDVVRQPDAPSS